MQVFSFISLSGQFLTHSCVNTNSKGFSSLQIGLQKYSFIIVLFPVEPSGHLS